VSRTLNVDRDVSNAALWTALLDTGKGTWRFEAIGSPSGRAQMSQALPRRRRALRTVCGDRRHSGGHCPEAFGAT